MEKKKAVIYSMVALIALVILIVGATYAYFQNQYGSASNADVNVTTYTTDVLTFETGDAINISADQESFAQGKGNKSGSTFARATLQANNKTNTATANYYVYLNISGNDFEYSKDSSSPELLLSITDNSGNQVTKLTGLNYITVTDGSNKSVSGFDITKSSGLLTLVDNKEISASPKQIEEWNITITLVNYNYDQNANTGKSFSAKLIIQKEKMKTTLADYVISQYTGTQGKNGIYYHDASLTNGANDNSYRYAGASDAVNNYVCFGSTQSQCPADNLYRMIGVFGDKVKLIKSDYATSVLLGADGDYSKMYTANGWDNSAYKGNNLANVAAYNWNKTRQNTWSLSNLNKTNLNTNFIANIGADWAAKIADTTWKVGGNTGANIYNQPAKTAYQNEIVNPVTANSQDNATEYSAKIGLMYASDYGFAAAPSAWTTQLNSYNGEAIKNVNWMYMGLYEWTISRYADLSYTAFYVHNTGYVHYNFVGNFAFAVRPVFSLTSSVNYVSGSGTAADPIRIN